MSYEFLSGTSQHAQRRLRQRGVPIQVLEWLLLYGTTRHDHHQGVWYFFDKRARERLRHFVDQKTIVRFQNCLNTYAVVSTDDCVLTVGHRQCRFRRDESRRRRAEGKRNHRLNR